MRQIKFRAFVKNLKWMVPVEMIDFKYQTAEVDLSYGNGDTSEYEFDEIELMQFTGLYDSGGTLIYEGDIVKMHYFSEEFASDLGVLEKDNTITGDIQYRQDFATYVVNTKDQDYTISEYCQEPSEELEVIGNIYEHPHLLQDKA